MNAALEFILEQIHGAWRFRWTAMLVAWIVCLLGWLVVLAMPDTYSAWARVYVDTRTRLSQVTQGIAVDSNIASQAEAVRQALLGGPQLEKVARLAMPGYAGASPERQATIIDGLRKRLQVEASGERNQPADLYMITYTDRDRRTAHRVVDQLLRLFLANSLGGSLQGSEQAQAFLTQQIAEYDSKLASAESRLADFKRQNAGLVPGATGDYFTHLHAETDNLDKDRLALTVAEQKRDELHRQLSSELPSMGSSAGIRTAAGEGAGGADTASAIRETQARLDRDYDVTRGQYQVLVERLNRAKLADKAEATGVVRFEVVDPPTGSEQPVSPDRIRLILVVLLGGLAAGAGAAYGMHQLRPVFVSARQLTEVTQLPVLGVVSMTWLERHQALARHAVWVYCMAAAVLFAVAAMMLLTQSATAHFPPGLIA